MQKGVVYFSVSAKPFVVLDGFCFVLSCGLKNTCSE